MATSTLSLGLCCPRGTSRGGTPNTPTLSAKNAHARRFSPLKGSFFALFSVFGRVFLDLEGCGAANLVVPAVCNRLPNCLNEGVDLLGAAANEPLWIKC